MWRVIYNLTPMSGVIQMATDHILAVCPQSVPWEGVIRFFIWDPPAVSLGYHQQTEIVNFDRCRERGWEVVRRPTGGRALLHQGDLSFSVIYYLPPYEENNLNSYSASPWAMMARGYDEVSQVVVEAFRSLGLDPMIEGLHKKNRSIHPPLKYLCLASRVKGEISVNGKKVVGIALRLYPRSLLFQGSIALKNSGSVAEILDIEESEIWGVEEHLRLCSASLEDLLGHTLPYDDVANRLWKAFKKIFPSRDIDFYPLTEEEEKAIVSQTGEFSLLSFGLSSSHRQTVSVPN